MSTSLLPSPAPPFSKRSSSLVLPPSLIPSRGASLSPPGSALPSPITRNHSSSVSKDLLQSTSRMSTTLSAAGDLPLPSSRPVSSIMSVSGLPTHSPDQQQPPPAQPPVLACPVPPRQAVSNSTGRVEEWELVLPLESAYVFPSPTRGGRRHSESVGGEGLEEEPGRVRGRLMGGVVGLSMDGVRFGTAHEARTQPVKLRGDKLACMLGVPASATTIHSALPPLQTHNRSSSTSPLPSPTLPASNHKSLKSCSSNKRPSISRPTSSSGSIPSLPFAASRPTQTMLRQSSATSTSSSVPTVQFSSASSSPNNNANATLPHIDEKDRKGGVSKRAKEHGRRKSLSLGFGLEISLGGSSQYQPNSGSMHSPTLSLEQHRTRSSADDASPRDFRDSTFPLSPVFGESPATLTTLAVKPQQQSDRRSSIGANGEKDAKADVTPWDFATPPQESIPFFPHKNNLPTPSQNSSKSNFSRKKTSSAATEERPSTPPGEKAKSSTSMTKEKEHGLAQTKRHLTGFLQLAKKHGRHSDAAKAGHRDAKGKEGREGREKIEAVLQAKVDQRRQGSGTSTTQEEKEERLMDEEMDDQARELVEGGLRRFIGVVDEDGTSRSFGSSPNQSHFPFHRRRVNTANTVNSSSPAPISSAVHASSMSKIAANNDIHAGRATEDGRMTPAQQSHSQVTAGTVEEVARDGKRRYPGRTHSNNGSIAQSERAASIRSKHKIASIDPAAANVAAEYARRPSFQSERDITPSNSFAPRLSTTAALAASMEPSPSLLPSPILLPIPSEHSHESLLRSHALRHNLLQSPTPSLLARTAAASPSHPLHYPPLTPIQEMNEERKAWTDEAKLKWWFETGEIIEGFDFGFRWKVGMPKEDGSIMGMPTPPPPPAPLLAPAARRKVFHLYSDEEEEVALKAKTDDTELMMASPSTTFLSLEDPSSFLSSSGSSNDIHSTPTLSFSHPKNPYDASPADSAGLATPLVNSHAHAFRYPNSPSPSSYATNPTVVEPRILSTPGSSPHSSTLVHLPSIPNLAHAAGFSSTSSESSLADHSQLHESQSSPIAMTTSTFASLRSKRSSPNLSQSQYQQGSPASLRGGGDARRLSGEQDGAVPVGSLIKREKKEAKREARGGGAEFALSGLRGIGL